MTSPAASPLRAPVDYAHLAPVSDLAVPLGADKLQIPRITASGAAAWGQSTDGTMPILSLGAQVDERVVGFAKIASRVTWRDEGRAQLLGVNLAAEFEREAAQVLGVALQRAVFVGEEALGWPSIFAEAGETNASTADLEGSSAPTTATVVQACLAAAGAVNESGRGQIVVNRIGISPALHRWLGSRAWSTGSDISARTYLFNELKEGYGLGPDAIKMMDPLDDPTAQKSRFVAAYADPAGLGYGSMLLTVPEPVLIVYETNARMSEWFLPCAGAFRRSARAIATATFTNSKIAAKS